MANQDEITKLIKDKAKQLGFSACGVSKVACLDDEAIYLKKWLNNGMNAGMQYMQNHFEKRINPKKLVNGVKSIISVLLNYYPEQKQNADSLKISKYAYGKDYHIVVKDKLYKLLSYLKEYDKSTSGRAFVDSAPVMDKAMAVRAGLGWIGKNSCLINKNLGSFVFIGELFLNIDLNYDKPEKEYCGTCTKCIDACPTKAIVSPGVVDSRKCISYYTIEHKGDIPVEFKGKFNNWVFGCDTCQDVCPWNKKKAKITDIPEFEIIPQLSDFSKDSFEEFSEETFRKVFKDSPIKRVKYKGLKRNIEFTGK